MPHGTQVASWTPHQIQISQLSPEDRALLGYLARYKGHTRDCYQIDLRKFAEWCARIEVPILRVERVHLELYIRQLQEAGYAESTVARKFGTVRGFLKYAAIDELIPKDPSVHVDMPKVDYKKQKRTWFTTLDFSAVMKQAMRDPKDHAVIVMLGFLGLRVGELCSLNVESLHRSVGQVQLQFIGKGGGLYKINLPFVVVQAVDRYLGDRTTGPLFLSNRGNRMQRHNVAAIIERLTRQAGVEYRVTPHGLRRTLARTLQERGVELGAIQQVLRHVDPRVTTMCYIGDGGGTADVARAMAAQIYSSMAA